MYYQLDLTHTPIVANIRCPMMELLNQFSAQQHLLPPVMFFAMLAIGLELRIEQFRILLLQPRVPILGTAIHSLTFPALAVTAIAIVQLASISLPESIVIGVLLIAACPSGGFSNVLTMMAKANLPLSIVLTAVSAILSFITVPLLLGGFEVFVSEFQGSIVLPMTQILVQLGTLILLPVILGMWMSAKLNWLSAERIVKYQKYTQLLLYITIGLMIVDSWDIMASGFLQALPWSAGLCVANILVCFGLSRAAGLITEDAITVALEGSIRNLGVAFLIAANTLDRMDIAVLPTIYFLSVLVFSILFAKNWRRIPCIVTKLVTKAT